MGKVGGWGRWVGREGGWVGKVGGDEYGGGGEGGWVGEGEGWEKRVECKHYMYTVVELLRSCLLGSQGGGCFHHFRLNTT